MKSPADDDPVQQLLRRRAAVLPSAQENPPRPAPAGPPQTISLVAIGASTGGPPALQSLLKAITTEPPFTIAVVQHMTPGFLPGMVRWLADTTGRRVVLADKPLELEPGLVVVAADGGHLELSKGRLAKVEGPSRRGHCPSIDVLFESIAATALASRCLGMLLTGMGEDGARGLLKLRLAGAYTLAQDEASSVVYGMPRVAHDLGADAEQLDLTTLGERLRVLAARP